MYALGVAFVYISPGNGAKLRSCVKVEVAVFGSPSRTSLMASVEVKQDLKKCSAPAAKLVVVWVWVWV